MNLFAIGPLTVSLLTLISGLFVYLINKKAKLNRLFFLLCISVFVWSFSYSQMYNAKNNFQIALTWARIGYIGVVFIPVFTYHYIITFLELKRNILTVLTVYLLGFIFLFISRTSLFLNTGYTYFWGYYPKAGPLYIFFVVFFVWIFVKIVFLLYSGLKLRKIASHHIQVNKLKYVLLGFAIATTSIVDYTQNYGFEIYPWGYLSALGWLICIGWASFRYRLMDINIILTRAGIFIFVYGGVLGLPFWVGSTTKSWFLATSLAVVLATLGPFIYSYLRRQAEQILLREQHRYQATLRELAKTMIRIRDLDQLLKMVVSTVVDTVKISSGGIYLRDELQKAFVLKHYLPQTAKYNFPELIPLDSPLVDVLDKQRRPLLHEELGDVGLSPASASLAVPSIIENDLLAFMLVGPKGDNQMFTSDDVLVFETVSYSTSLAIENCHFWKEIEDRQRKARLQEMDTYSYSLAHEIDNPMQVVIGQADLLQKYMLNELNPPQEKQQEMRESFNYILEAARRVSGMVKAIRDFGQATTGELKPLKMEDIVESFAKLYFPQFKANSVIFQQAVPAGLGFVRGEKPELMQVLVILANNALHAMRYSRDKKVSLKAERFQNDHIRLSFKDSGCGVKKEMLPIIFAPFTTTKASSEGTGMGLYNAQKIINRHHGKIWAESEGENRGTTFFIELPIAEGVNEEDFKKEQQDKRIF